MAISDRKTLVTLALGWVLGLITWHTYRGVCPPPVMAPSATESVQATPAPAPEPCPVELPPPGGFTFDQCMAQQSMQIDKYRADGWNEVLFSFKVLNESSVYLDIGGFIGETAQIFRDRYHPQMFIVEPSAKNCEVLKEKLPTATIFNFGIGTSDVPLYLTPEGMAAVITPNNVPGSELVTLKPWGELEKLVPKKIDLLFINCEGCEYPVLEALLESPFLYKIDAIYIQFHLLNNFAGNGPRRCHLRSRLRYTHQLEYESSWVWEIWTRRPGLTRGS